MSAGRAEAGRSTGGRRGDGGRDRDAPEVSVIVPVHRCADMLPDTLGALRRSDLPEGTWELVVVDDASRDRTPDVAEEYADRVLRLRYRPRGPAYARNRGAEVASGEILVFIDADVRVRPDTLRRLRDAVDAEPDVAAVFGSYDADPPAGGVASRYRNLLHHWTHQQHPGEAETFWAGCGAVRRAVFLEVGMYDEWHFSRPQIEDIELGRRIRGHGYRILLRPEIQVTHLKAWTLRNVLVTDFRSRGIPWTRLLMHEGSSEASSVLNVEAREKVCSALVGSSLPAALAALVLWSAWPLAVAGAGAGTVVLLNHRFYRFLGQRGGWTLMLASVPLHLFYYMQNCVAATSGWLLYNLVGPPPPPVDAAAFEEVEEMSSPPIPRRPSKSTWLKNGS